MIPANSLKAALTGCHKPGTSFAAPMLAGAALLVAAADRTPTNRLIERLLAMRRALWPQASAAEHHQEIEAMRRNSSKITVFIAFDAETAAGLIMSNGAGLY